jgi:enoyl-[acyl-carrier-protein] reductase (NADH)
MEAKTMGNMPTRKFTELWPSQRTPATSPLATGICPSDAQLRQFAEILREDYPQLAALVYSIPFAPKDERQGLYDQVLLYLEIYESNALELQSPK